MPTFAQPFPQSWLDYFPIASHNMLCKCSPNTYYVNEQWDPSITPAHNRYSINDPRSRGPPAMNRPQTAPQREFLGRQKRYKLKKYCLHQIFCWESPWRIYICFAYIYSAPHRKVIARDLLEITFINHQRKDPEMITKCVWGICNKY